MLQQLHVHLLCFMSCGMCMLPTRMFCVSSHEWIGANWWEFSGWVFIMSLTDSSANFRARADALGVDSAVVRLLVDGGLDTMSKFAFSSAYVPGQQDETQFVEALKSVMHRDPTIPELAVLRRLLHECYAITAAELKQTVERSEDAPPKRLAQPDRADRRERQQKRLKGINIQGFREPSDRLVDKCVAIYEDNRLAYVDLTTCTSKDAEVKASSSSKEDKHLTIDASGNVRMKGQQWKIEADISSDLLLQYALERRGLALEQANIFAYDLHDMWVSKLFEARYREPPVNYSRVTQQQMIHADKQLFVKLAELTRGGIQLQGSSMPVDDVMVEAMNSTEVQHLLQPMPGSSQSSSSTYNPKGPGKGGFGLRRGGGGKNKGGRGNTGNVHMPKLLAHGVPNTTKGNPICFDHNLGKCTRPVKFNRCDRGLHICCMKGCFKTDHIYTSCPKKPSDE